MFLTRREPGVPVSLFRPYPLPFFPSFSSILFLTLPFLLCLFHWSISAVVSAKHSICCFPCCSKMFLTRNEPGVPLSLFRPYPLPFLLLFFYIVPYPSFSSMSFSLTYICCSFRGGILSAVFPTVAICFWPAGNLELPLSLFRPYPLPFSPPFLYIFLTLPVLLCLFHWSISAVVSGEAFYLLFSPL